ncbi:MAG: gliding motility-associated C-terminal domain-containing protein [Bacteroidales bacterium]|nr:gliding motility-associated C-terminal domain-containing protein [Bacteroidales bacterium]
MAQTVCAPVQLPFVEDFDEVPGSRPVCWFARTNSNDAIYRPGLGSNWYPPGVYNKYFYFYCYNYNHYYDSVFSIVATPELADTLAGWFAVLDIRNEGRAVLEYGVCTDTLAADTLTGFAPLLVDTVARIHRVAVPLSGRGRFAIRCAFKNHIDDGNYSTAYIDRIAIVDGALVDAKPTHVGAVEATVAIAAAGRVTLQTSWREEGSSHWVTVDDTSAEVRLQGLAPLTTYEVMVVGSTGAGDDSIRFKIRTKLRPSECLDAADLGAGNVTCLYGSFWNPYSDTGAVDYGYASALSRHTVHYDPDETDPRTDSLLHTTPPTGGTAVRLGNWLVGAQGEAVDYAIRVDTLDFSTIIFSYAAVMENPEHSADAQPLLYIQVLDTLGNAIDTQCVYARFVSSYDLGWNRAPHDSTILWKEWTSVGLNLTPYHGQTIVLRITTLDCAQWGHYGYAYFTLDCANGGITILTCGTDDTYTYASIPGFDHRWYTATDTTTFSTADTITLPASQTATIFCEHTNRAKHECRFVERIDNVAHIPVASASYTYRPVLCSYMVTLTSTGIVTTDGATPVEDGDRITFNYWEHADSSYRYGAVDSLLLPPGQHGVTLVSGNRSGCKDTTVVTIDLPDYIPDTLHYYDTVCQRSVYDSNGFSLNRDSTDHYPSRNYVRMDVDSNLCPLAVELHLEFHPVEVVDTNDTIVKGQIYAWADTIYTLPGTYYKREDSTVYGCDSLTALHLAVVTPQSEITDSCSALIDILQGDTHVVSSQHIDFELESDLSAHYYLWQPDSVVDSSGNRSVSFTLPPDTTATFILETTYEDSTNIIPNGGFDLGDSLFGSDYRYVNAFGVNDTDVYTLLVPEVPYPDTVDCMAGSTLSLMALPSEHDSLRLYYIDVAVDPHTDYRLHYSISTLAQPDSVSMVWFVGTDTLDTTGIVVPEICGWTHRSADFATEDDTIITLTLYDRSFSLGTFNIIVVDSITLHRLCRAEDSLTIRTECPDIHDTIEIMLCRDSVFTVDDENSVKEPGVHTFTLKTEGGCDSVLTVRAIRNPCCVDYLQFPNAVTPNGDGINDRFVIVGLLDEWCYPFNELAIYNKWGERVFYRRNITSEADFWDPNDGNYPAGTYFFHFDAKTPDESKHIQRRGVIEVLREVSD